MATPTEAAEFGDLTGVVARYWLTAELTVPDDEPSEVPAEIEEA